MPNLQIVIEKLYTDVLTPKRQTEGSAGYDLHAYLKGQTVQCYDTEGNKFTVEARDDGKVYIPVNSRALIPTGFKLRLPAGYEGQIRVRSSTAFKRGFDMPNSPGTLDEDYTGVLYVMLRNTNGFPTPIEHNERIAQLVISKYETPAFVEDSVEQTTDRVGGIGSTGK